MNLRCPAPKKEGKMRIRAFPVSFQLFIFFCTLVLVCGPLLVDMNKVITSFIRK